MMGLGGQELIVIFLIILLLFGAKKLPELAKGVGKSMGEFNKAKQEFEHEIKRAQVDAEKTWDEPEGKQPARIEDSKQA
ncbi:MAG: twin-arginine translocase TatA/TatE family subunit [Verrucomicrobiota bacterium]